MGTCKSLPILLGLAFLFFFIAPILFQSSAQQTQPTDAPPAWQWSWETIQSIVGKVRAGKDLTPRPWPGNNKVAVALSFDLDNETPSLRDGNLSPGELSQGEYGSRVGLGRVLALLDKYQIKASFFIPAVVAKLYPNSIKQIVAKGHEVGIHGWIHERNSLLTEEQERQLMKQAAATLEEISGTRPTGLRTPSWDYSPHTMKLIRELGLLYDSSLMADERPYEVMFEGKPTGVVELPVEWILDDYPYFGMSRFSTIRPHIGPEDVLDIWRKEFDTAYQEGSLFVLTMHPHITGHRSRIVILEKLIQHMKSKQGVWFARHDQVAKAARRKLQ
ncbi:MAG TPA: polysaccharide deacetylase [Acidobacteriota bacterium]|nr:polysaccharide deacetylase [Acidobacteriota bacterium]